MITTILLVLAFVLFLLGAIPRMAQPFSFVSAGLAAYTLSLLIR